MEGKLRHLCRQCTTRMLGSKRGNLVCANSLQHPVDVLIFFYRFQLATSVALRRTEASVNT